MKTNRFIKEYVMIMPNRLKRLLYKCFVSIIYINHKINIKTKKEVENMTTNIKKIIKEDTGIYTNTIINKFRYSKLIKEQKLNVRNKNITLKDLINSNKVYGITNGGF